MRTYATSQCVKLLKIQLAARRLERDTTLPSPKPALDIKPWSHTPARPRAAKIDPSETLVAPHRERQTPGAQGPFAMTDLYSGQSKPGISMSGAILISLVACALSNAAFAETIKLACHFNEEVSLPSGSRSCHQSL
jgi:hypothetical protein